MRVQWLNRDHTTYTGNAYLVRGEWNALADVNTLVDPGRDPILFASLAELATGAGKTKVDQVVLTHAHFDHAGLLPEVCERWHPTVWAANPCVSEAVRRCGHTECAHRRQPEPGQMLRLGDADAVILRTHAHSCDSVVIYCEAAGVLFTGDAPLPIISGQQHDFDIEYLDLLRWLSGRKVDAIYPGHGEPVLSGGLRWITDTLDHLDRATHVERSPPREVLGINATH